MCQHGIDGLDVSLCTSPIIHIFDSQKGPPFPPALPPFRPTLVVPQARHVVCGKAKGGLACGASSLRGRHCCCDSLHLLALLPLRRMLLACGSELARWPDGLVRATRARAARRNHSSQPEAFACDRRLSIPMAVKHKGGGMYGRARTLCYTPNSCLDGMNRKPRAIDASGLA